MSLPVLDNLPSGRPQDWSLREIKKMQMEKPGAVTFQRPKFKHDPNIYKLAKRNQDKGGTCTGMAYSIYADLNYMHLTGDIPTPDELAQYKPDQIDTLGTRRDIFHPDAFSAECCYQMGRYFGNITYPSGGEIRFNARAARDYGFVLESMWHTDKERTHVWMYPPGPRKTVDGGVTPEEAASFASRHRIKGWAMVGRSDGDATWDEILDAIAQYNWVLCGIPIYANYVDMAGGDGTYPLPKGDIVGYHAQILTGYDEETGLLDIEHSWYGWCGQHGHLSKDYYNHARDQSVFMVCIDDEEVLIAQTINSSLTITSNVPSQLTLTVFPNLTGTIIGITPQTIALEVGKEYSVTASAAGYISQTKKADDSTTELTFVLDAVPANETFWQGILRFLQELWRKLRHGH